MALPLRRLWGEVLVAVNAPQKPPNVPGRLWIVQLATGERHFVDKEPLGGIAAWAAGQRGVTIAEYDFGRVAYHAPAEQPKKK